MPISQAWEDSWYKLRPLGKYIDIPQLIMECTNQGIEKVKDLCYTKILSPSCDKTFDIPTCLESQLLEWKPNVFLSICHTNSQHYACPFIQEWYPCSHCLSSVVHKWCHHPFPLVHRRLLLELLYHRRRSVIPWVKREKEKFLEASRR